MFMDLKNKKEKGKKKQRGKTIKYTIIQRMKKWFEVIIDQKILKCFEKPESELCKKDYQKILIQAQYFEIRRKIHEFLVS